MIAATRETGLQEINELTFSHKTAFVTLQSPNIVCSNSNKLSYCGQFDLEMKNKIMIDIEIDLRN